MLTEQKKVKLQQQQEQKVLVPIPADPHDVLVLAPERSSLKLVTNWH